MADAFKVGDRILYFAGSNDHQRERLGKTGTIVALADFFANERRYRIAWDDGYSDSSAQWRESNLKRIAKPTQADIDDALSLLREAGEVTFKPFKPPFQQETVVLNGNYNALVTDKFVIAGCQRFDFSAIEALAEAVAKARAYNAE